MTSPLTQPSVIWAIYPGASGSRLWRRVGQGFLCLSGMVALAWSAELCHDLWVHQSNRMLVAPVVAGLLAWCFWLGRLWRAWSCFEPALQLHWTGGSPEQAHWHLVEWNQAVKVRVVCDFQDWVLLQVSSLPSHEPKGSDHVVLGFGRWVSRCRSGDLSQIESTGLSGSIALTTRGWPGTGIIDFS